MVSNSQNPYKVIEENPLDYSFVSRDGINYHLYFTPISSIYPDLVNTYSFSIEREGTNPHPIDLRIAATVVHILRRFFETIENAMIMVCDSTDGKQHKRRNLFDHWFRYYNDGTLTTINAEVGEGDYPFFRICNLEAVNMSICNAGMNDVRQPCFHSFASRDCRRLLVFGSSFL